MPRIMLATLCLNEMEWLPELYEQHKNWPGVAKWVFVESADVMYAKANPTRVNKLGLSVDGTSEFLINLESTDPKIVYIPLGFSHADNPAQGKCEARNAYLQMADRYEPTFVYVIDADEFYPHKTQRQVNREMLSSAGRYTSFCFKQRHIWHPPSIRHLDRFQYEVVGGFWKIPHCRGWRWFPGMRHISNHNTPEARIDGDKMHGLDRRMRRLDRQPNSPECVHLGFASSILSRHAKNAYYAARGEGVTDHRGWYVESRAAYETWQPGNNLPEGANVLHYQGMVPEVFMTQVEGGTN